ncbi:MAG TPA: hypothetical protein VHU85_12980 [Acidimicrobiales bacterium]|jgi:hypothetical protein|nr:hypothetical protein [Acidimicrobiales bacterium]
MPDSPPIGSPPVQASVGGRLRSLVANPGLPISLLFFAGAVLVALSAFIHLHLWSTGYRQIHTIGPLFLLQAIAGFMVAVAVAGSRHYLIAAAGASFVAGTIAGLVVSVEVGLFGFRDSFSAPYATSSLVVEGLAVVMLASAALAARRRSRPVRPFGHD